VVKEAEPDAVVAAHFMEGPRLAKHPSWETEELVEMEHRASTQKARQGAQHVLRRGVQVAVDVDEREGGSAAGNGNVPGGSSSTIVKKAWKRLVEPPDVHIDRGCIAGQ
jgi:hypothetical protein